MRECYIKDIHNNTLYTSVYDEIENPKGVIQVIHGINEHGKRYEEFAKYLNSEGYIVYITDHVSQGLSRTSDDNEVVYFGKNGDQVLVDGLIATKNRIEKDYPNLKVYLFGHSLGSMIIRKYLINYDNTYSKIIINGGGYAPTKGLSTAIFIGGLMKLFGKKKPSDMFDSQFRNTQLRLNEKVEIDHFIEWLTRDKEKTEINKTDDFLYIRLSVSVFVDMIKMIKEINTQKNIEKMDIKCPILLLSGTHDPATDFGEGTVKLHEIFTSFGYKSDIKLYEEGRHDTIQEINRQEVYKDIVSWLGE